MTLTELCQKHSFKPDGILHVGAAMLEEAEEYRDLGVKTVIWVEALPGDEERRERAKLFGHELHELLPLSDENNDIILKVTTNTFSSSILPLKRHYELYPEVTVEREIKTMSRRADGYFTTFPKEINTLVLDVQGAELKVLRGMGQLIYQFQWCLVETFLTELYEGCALKPELDRWMRDRGFQNAEYIPVLEGEWGDTLYRREFK